MEVPEAGGLAPRCRDYLTEQAGFQPDIVIREADFEPHRYSEKVSQNAVCYVESGRLFHINLLPFNAMALHASAVEYQGRV